MQVFIRRSLSAFSGKRGAAVVAILWTVLIVSAAAWNIQSEWTVTLRLARAAALANYNKDLMYRRWAAGHGGVYAPITDQTPPNPYLANMPERDIFTPSGRALTLINPAYMTRQVYELSAEQYGVRGHITSLKPIRPENAPDEWERQALQAFETGQPEAAEVVVMDGTRYFRLMRPLITEERCMGCHAFQGYKVGDIRGGISVAVPLAIYDEVARAHVTSTILIAGLAWLVGLGGGLIVYQSWRRATINRERYQKALQESEARFRLLAENSTDMISRHDLQGVYLYASPACLALLGYKPEELVGHPAFEFIHPEDNPVVEQSRLSIINQPAAFTTTYRVRRKDGGYLWLETISHTLFDETGAPVEIHATSRDITERKRVEDALRESEILMRSAVEAASGGRGRGGTRRPHRREEWRRGR